MAGRDATGLKVGDTPQLSQEAVVIEPEKSARARRSLFH
jgi:hypothetical protein